MFAMIEPKCQLPILIWSIRSKVFEIIKILSMPRMMNTQNRIGEQAARRNTKGTLPETPNCHLEM